MYAIRFFVDPLETVQHLMTQYCHNTKRRGVEIRAQGRGCESFALVYYEQRLDPKRTLAEVGTARTAATHGGSTGMGMEGAEGSWG